MITLLLLTLLYFLPSIVGKDKKDAGAIFLVNLLLGWTVVGWVAAMVWACAADHPVYVRYLVPAGGRFCSHCGTPAAAVVHYCASCGTRM